MKINPNTKVLIKDVVKWADSDGVKEKLDAIRKSVANGMPDHSVPPHKPQNIVDAVKFGGPCAVPMRSGDKWVYHPVCFGNSICDGKTMKLVMMDDYNEAIAAVTAYYNKHKK